MSILSPFFFFDQVKHSCPGASCLCIRDKRTAKEKRIPERTDSRGCGSLNRTVPLGLSKFWKSLSTSAIWMLTISQNPWRSVTLVLGLSGSVVDSPSFSHLSQSSMRDLRQEHTPAYNFIKPTLLCWIIHTYMEINENFEDYHRHPTFPELFETKLVVTQSTTRY